MTFLRLSFQNISNAISGHNAGKTMLVSMSKCGETHQQIELESTGSGREAMPRSKKR